MFTACLCASRTTNYSILRIQQPCANYAVRCCAHLLQRLAVAATAQDVVHHLVVQQLSSSRCWAVSQQLGQGVAKQALEEIREQLPAA
jgi:hypothetical protein